MTEAEWLACKDPLDMLHSPGWRRVRRTTSHGFSDSNTCHPLVTSERKLRLYSCACFRLSFPRLVCLADQLALDVAERFSDAKATNDELTAISQRCGCTASSVTRPSALDSARGAIGGNKVRANHPAGFQQLLSNTTRCALLRCIFGNPFRPVTVAPDWKSETAVALATGIYQERAFDRLPILADALEEAGCDHPDVLGHCRRPGPHARGCWVVDLVLGKS